MKESIESIIKWHRETFTDATLEGQIAKFMTKTKEFQTARDNSDEQLFELADLFIVACGIARFDPIVGAMYMSKVQQSMEETVFCKEMLTAAIDKKMEINRGRTWDVKDGNYQHKKEPATKRPKPKSHTGQRVFDMENEQDVRDLFDILPDRIEKITREQAEDSGRTIIYGLEHLFNIKWGHMVYVNRPVDKSKWIGCLCRFWDDYPELYSMGILKELCEDTMGNFVAGNGLVRKNCCPVKRSEIKFVEDME